MFYMWSKMYAADQPMAARKKTPKFGPCFEALWNIASSVNSHEPSSAPSENRDHRDHQYLRNAESIRRSLNTLYIGPAYYTGEETRPLAESTGSTHIRQTGTRQPATAYIGSPGPCLPSSSVLLARTSLRFRRDDGAWLPSACSRECTGIAGRASGAVPC